MENELEIVSRVIRERRTLKILADVDSPISTPDPVLQTGNETVRRCLVDAGWAPFHFPRNVNEIAEPWRAHIIWQAQAQELGKWMRDELDDQGKLPQLLAGCGAVVVATWLPETTDQAALRDKVAKRNEEHLAAASAMVQNLLLLLTAAGMGTYWSSGGAFASDEVITRLKMNAEERLLGAIFVDYGETIGATDSKPGAHREKRTTDWIREV